MLAIYYKCDSCGKYYSDEAGTKEISLDSTVVEAKGHSMSAVEAKDATCTDKGNTAYYTCAVCGKYYSDEKGASEIEKEDTVIAAKGHTMTFVEAKDATETADGNIAYYTCEVCGKYFSDKDGKTEIDKEDTIIKYEGHVHSLSKVDAKEATCTEQGNIEYYFCEGCKKYFSDAEGKTEIELSSTVIPAAHDLTQTPAKEATCTEDGNTAYYTCSVCKKYFSDAEGKTEIELSSTVIPAAHTLTETPAKEATCTEDGNTAYYTCSVCKKYFFDAEGKKEIDKEDTVVAAGHAKIVVTVTQEPTATAEGKVEKKCSVCEEIVETITLPMLTTENYENGTYDYSVSYRYDYQANETGTRVQVKIYRDGQYTYATDLGLEEPLVFIVEGTSSINASSAATLGAQTSTPAMHVTESINDITFGKYLKAEPGWFKLTVETLDAAPTITIINPDGTYLDFIPTEDNPFVYFQTSDTRYSVIVAHSASSQKTVYYTVEESEPPTVNVGEQKTISFAERNEVQTFYVSSDLEAGTYAILMKGPTFGRSSFIINVNGDTYNLSPGNTVTGYWDRTYVGFKVVVELKPGDTFTITSTSIEPCSGTLTLEAVTE